MWRAVGRHEGFVRIVVDLAQEIEAGSADRTADGLELQLHLR